MNTDMTGKQAFRIIFGALVAYLLFCQFGCSSQQTGNNAIEVAPWNPLRILPGFVGHYSTTLTEGQGHGYGWMWQVLAVSIVASVAISVFIEHRFPKGTLSLLLLGAGCSIWGPTLEILKGTLNWLVPVVVIGFLVWCILDPGVRAYNKYFKGAVNEGKGGGKRTRKA